MKTTKKFLCLLLFFTSINATYSKVNINETEKAINRKIDNALSLILSKNDYLTNIKIETEKVSNSKSQNSATQGSVNENLNEKEDYFLFRKLGLDSNVELEPQNADKKELLEEKSNTQNIFRSYILIEWDEGAANKRLLDQIQADKELYDAMRATDLLNEMEEKVEAYRNRMNK